MGTPADAGWASGSTAASDSHRGSTRPPSFRAVRLRAAIDHVVDLLRGSGGGILAQASARIGPSRSPAPGPRQRRAATGEEHDPEQCPREGGVGARVGQPDVGPVRSGRGDSNPRPPAPKAGALPGCATPRTERAVYGADADSTGSLAGFTVRELAVTGPVSEPEVRAVEREVSGRRGGRPWRGAWRRGRSVRGGAGRGHRARRRRRSARGSAAS